MTVSLYAPGRGYLYRMDPRAKLFGTIMTTASFFLPLPSYVLWVGALFLFVVVVGTMGVRSFRLVVKPLLFIMGMVLLFSPIYGRTGIPLLMAGDVVVLTKEGLERTLVFCARFAGISFSWGLLLRTTPMQEIILVLRSWKVPYRAALVITLVFRFIPFFSRTFTQVREAHLLRLPPEEIRRKLSLATRLADFMPTLASTLVTALKMIPHLAMSLELRGLGRTNPRSSYHRLSRGWRVFTDFFISIIMPVILAVIFLHA
ncbi:energy-coupling factor transporter transmembrane component T [Parasphaerochaeta coccoides]|uniref:Cobalt transport protein n=1 Tax=Parasphaerochaeta coccoides (strain ATCC BAA-1237 / DSM 17374 / SPN1) TaxID=760011 RepID=F4GM57_PARC1|nr:energy-coupling factor transporter transmembrane component T [Parasphaerochaeta coccoides]AEC02532.1 cobalt transport protein [Parasphaerochaeta coccoides DSM 17374]